MEFLLMVVTSIEIQMVTPSNIDVQMQFITYLLLHINMESSLIVQLVHLDMAKILLMVLMLLTNNI